MWIFLGVMAVAAVLEVISISRRQDAPKAT
jgi:hypothetical protein